MMKRYILSFSAVCFAVVLLLVGYKVYKRYTRKARVYVTKEAETSRIRIKDFENVYDMIGDITRFVGADSTDFVKELDTIAMQRGLESAEDLKVYFFSDTYDFYKNVSAKAFFDFFERQYNDFWTEERISKQTALGLTREQVYTLASIVEKETGGRLDEQKRVAGLYLNRFRKNMELKSCPTVIYAIRKAENSKREIKRLYLKDLNISSPYNTYLNKGFPKGPICIVTKATMDNVLDAEENDYLYMSADPNRPGYNRFTSSGKEHMKNASEYRRWLNSKKIK